MLTVHKKGDYRPVSLLPIFGKVFEKILFNSIFEYLQENCLLCDNQSGFQPSDSCEYQLLSIVHDIYASFDCNPPKDVRGIFLDISKAFDRVWHEGLIYKMKCIGMTGVPLKLLQNILQNRHQKQHKNIKNSQNIEQNLALFFPFYLFTATCASSKAEFFHFLNKVVCKF